MPRTLDLSDNARRVLESRYLRRDEKGEVVETPEELFGRVARAAARAELLLGGGAPEARRWEERFGELLLARDFLPNSPTLMNAGTPLGQLSACFVLPVGDSMEEIFEALRAMALVQRSGGGTGFSFSRLRPRGDRISSTGGTTPGPVSFMRIFDSATEHIRLGGKRRGANMGILRVDHPDILEFVEAKTEGEEVLRNFNISVGATDEFMEAAERGAAYDLVNPRTGQAAGRLDAGALFERIARAAWRTGDPGLVFLDAINRRNPTPQLGEIEATNPCGEVPLLPYESCNLGSVNLGHMIRDGNRGEAAVDWDRLGATVRTAVRFLDAVIEVNRLPLKEIARATRRTRKIGLGVMGFAEMLIRLGISYDSDEATGMAGRAMGFIAETSLEASRQLAEERGVYPAWEGGLEGRAGVRARNATRNAVAPTGTIGIIADTSPGIEPLFALAYRRVHVLEDETLVEVNPLLRRHLERLGLESGEAARRAFEAGSLEGVPDVPEGLRRLFVTALEVPPERHLEVQAAFQEHTDNSVSKTVNLPEGASAGEVARVYRRAWELGLKGITVFRHGSRSVQVVELGMGEEPYQKEHEARCDPTECRV